MYWGSGQVFRYDAYAACMIIYYAYYSGWYVVLLDYDKHLQNPRVQLALGGTSKLFWEKLTSL